MGSKVSAHWHFHFPLKALFKSASISRIPTNHHLMNSTKSSGPSIYPSTAQNSSESFAPKTYPTPATSKFILTRLSTRNSSKVRVNQNTKASQALSGSLPCNPSNVPTPVTSVHTKKCPWNHTETSFKLAYWAADS